MAATERKIPGTFAPVPGGYSQQISANTALFIPDFSVSRYDPSTGEVYGYAPDYDALEAAKTPAVQATAPGEYSYCYEMQQAPTGCDYAADLAYYGKHYFLRPLRDDLPPLHGRGITYDAEQGTYMVTLRAYDKIKAQYKIKRETCLDCPARPTHNAPPVQARPPCKGWALMGNKHDHKPGTNSQRAPIANNGRQPAGVLA